MERRRGKPAPPVGAHQGGVKHAVFFEKVENVAAGLLVGADQFRQEFGNGPWPELVKVDNQPMKSGVK